MCLTNHDMIDMQIHSPTQARKAKEKILIFPGPRAPLSPGLKCQCQRTKLLYRTLFHYNDIGRLAITVLPGFRMTGTRKRKRKR